MYGCAVRARSGEPGQAEQTRIQQARQCGLDKPDETNEPLFHDSAHNDGRLVGPDDPLETAPNKILTKWYTSLAMETSPSPSSQSNSPRNKDRNYAQPTGQPESTSNPEERDTSQKKNKKRPPCPSCDLVPVYSSLHQ